MTSSRGGPLEFHNIQEIVDIDWWLNLFACFYLSLFIYLFILLVFYPQMIRKIGNNSKTEKVVTYYYITVP